MTSTTTDRLYGESTSVAIKAPVIAVTNGVQLPLSGLTTVAGYTPNPGDRILVKDQADATTNGIYCAATGAWARTGDFNGPYSCVQGTLVIAVLSNGQSLIYQLSTPTPIIGTTDLSFVPFWNPNVTYPQTPIEALKGVVPVNENYQFGNPFRYGAVGGVVNQVPAADDSAAIQDCFTVGYCDLPVLAAFKVITPCAIAGQVTMLGKGKTSQIYCDSNVVTVTSGNYSFFDNFAMFNVTDPWVITRNPANWTAFPTLTQSSTVLGYQPTVNDGDIWSSLTSAQQNQQIGPVLFFTGLATGIEVSRIYGRFVRVEIRDAVNSVIHDCDVRGGKGQWGVLEFDNWTNSLQRGSKNRAINNRVQYGSFTGTYFASNDDFENSGNHISFGGESGTKTLQCNGVTFTTVTLAPGTTTATISLPGGGFPNGIWTFLFQNGETRAVTITGNTTATWVGGLASAVTCACAYQTALNPQCFRGQIENNRCSQMFYDGLDCDSTFGTTVDCAMNYHQINNNYAYNNGGNGINADGQFNTYVGNKIYGNGRYGFWGLCSFSLIEGNHFIGNNVTTSGSQADLLCGAQGNTIIGNRIYFTAAAGFPMYAVQAAIQVPHVISRNVTIGGANFYGNPGTIVPCVSDNIDSTTGYYTDQAFTVILQNNGGTLQHVFYSDASETAFGLADKIVGATAGGFTNTPTGTDATTAFGAGAKISTNVTNAMVFNVGPQDSSNVQMLAVAHSLTGTALVAECAFENFSVNGVAQNRLIISLFNATTGGAVALTTGNIGAGTNIKIQFLGKLA
ncbi:MAG TPA: hypothetical protein VGG49_13325 [Steroidobacteraceae bacterium]|jgi:hypothetical protein